MKEVADREPAPELAESLDDESGVADPGDRAQPDDHLLVDDEYRNQQGSVHSRVRPKFCPACA